jgi:4-amino-4-deoxy-L-arabinose transferase-like glycosyltransferase
MNLQQRSLGGVWSEASVGPWIGLFGLACAIRLLWVLLSPALLTSDASFYDQAGWQIATGKGYVINERPTAYWPVGYPAFLALVYLAAGHSPAYAQLIQVLLGAGTVVLAARLITRIHGGRAGFTAGALLALSPNDSSYPALLVSETVFTALFIAAIYVILRAEGVRGYVASGVLFGLAALVRPVVLLLPVWLGLWVAWRHRSTLRKGIVSALPYAVVFATMLLTLSPWAIRNWVALGYPVLVSTNGGINLYIGNNPGATGGYQPITTPSVRAVWGDEVARERVATREAVTFIATHPLVFVRLVVQRAVLLFARGWDGIYEHLRATRSPVGHGTRLALYGLAEMYYLLLLFACAASFFDRRGSPPVMGLLVAVAVYWIAVHVIVMAEPRYRFPIMPIITAFAAVYVSKRLPERLWNRSWGLTTRSPRIENTISSRKG